MGKVTEIKTKIRIDYMHIYKLLVKDGYGIAIANTKPIDHVYMPHISVRKIDIYETKSGYEVRILFFACFEEYELYRDIIKHFMELTKGIAIDENGNKLTNPEELFKDDYINWAVESDLELMLKLIENGEEIGLDCPFRWFYIGKNLGNKLLSLKDNRVEAAKQLFGWVRKSQYEDMEAINTPLYKIENKNKTLTVFRNTTNRYIGFADYFGLWEVKNDSHIDIPYDKIVLIKPDKWQLYDEKQYYAPMLTDSEWKILWEKAKEYQISNF